MKKNQRKYSVLCTLSCILVALALSAAGCGDKAEISEGQSEPESGSAAESTPTPAPLQTTGQQLYVRDYLRLELKDPILEYQSKLLYAASSKDKIYILSQYTAGEDIENPSRQLYLSIYEEGVRALEPKPFKLEVPGKEDWFIHSIAAARDGELSIRLQKLDDAEAPHCLAVTDLEGNLLSVEDPFPEEAAYPWNPEFPFSRKIFYCADEKLIYYQWDSEAVEAHLFSYDPENGDKNFLGTLRDSGQLSAAYGASESILYYTDSKKRLIRWDTAADIQTQMLSLNEISFPSTPKATCLMPDSHSRLLLCALESSSLGIYTLSEEEYQPEDQIRMAVLRTPSYFALNTAAEYTYSHWSCPVTVEQPEGSDADTFRDQILVELATGNGPDMMWVYTDDVQLLAEKGVLMDLTELIPQEASAQLFPCVIQAGTVDGRLVALTTELMVDTMAVSDDVWTEASWELSDFLELLEEERWEYPIQENYFFLTPMRCLKALLPDLPHSPFLDIEQGTVHFDSEDFLKILEICSRYEDGVGQSAEFTTENAECLAKLRWITNMTFFSEYMAQDSGSFHMTGYPMEGGGHLAYPFSSSYLVVNAKTKHLEEIKEYIALLLDYDRLLNSSDITNISVRKDVVQDKMILRDGKPMYLSHSDNGMIYADQLTLKPDGSSYLEEFMAFMESCTAKPRWPTQVEIILTEELTPYFAGDKSAEDAVAVLQNRMQLYLDENRH